MVPNMVSAAPLVRACSEFPCTLRGSVPPHRSLGTCVAGANTTDLLPDVVVSAGEALRSGTAVGEVVFPGWPRDRTADAVDVSAAAAADIAAAVATMGAAVVHGAVGAVVALDAYVVDDPADFCDLDHRRGAWRSVCRGGLGHGLRLWPRRCHQSHEQGQARGPRHSFSLSPTESSPPEQFQLPGFSSRNHLSLRLNEPHQGIGELGRSVLKILFRGRVLSLDASLVSSRPRARERNIQRQAHLLLRWAIRTRFLPCRMLLLTFRQQLSLSPAMLLRETHIYYHIQYPFFPL